jgi:predicted nucleic acid-binding protein
MTIVLNTNALSTFHRTNSLNVVESLFVGQDVLAPEGVVQELLRGNFTPPSFIKRITLTGSQSSTANSIGGLHPGEREAIVLAKDTDGLLITDDREAKKKAQGLGVNVVGCLTVIKNAFTECHIYENERDRIIKEGRMVSYWPEDIVREILSLRKGGTEGVMVL